MLYLKVITKKSPYCPFEDIKDATMVAKLHRHLQSFHQRELRVSNLRRINLEIEELEGSKEIATTERDFKSRSVVAISLLPSNSSISRFIRLRFPQVEETS